MKIFNYITAIAIFLSTPLLASAAIGADPIKSSFERELNHELVQGATLIARNDSDPLVDAINVALYGNATDAVIASFERELNHEMVQGATMIARNDSDPLVDAIVLALNGGYKLNLA